MSSAPQSRAQDDRSDLRDRQPLADHSRKTSSKKHQQLGSVTRVEAQLRALAKRKQSHRERRLAIDPDERLRADEIAGRSKQWMATLDGAHLDAAHSSDLAAKKRWVHLLHTSAIGPKSLVGDDQRQGHGINPEDQGPFLSHDVE